MSCSIFVSGLSCVVTCIFFVFDNLSLVKINGAKVVRIMQPHKPQKKEWVAVINLEVKYLIALDDASDLDASNERRSTRIRAFALLWRKYIFDVFAENTKNITEAL